jgi:hypothetical protein
MSLGALHLRLTAVCLRLICTEFESNQKVLLNTCLYRLLVSSVYVLSGNMLSVGQERCIVFRVLISAISP